MMDAERRRRLTAYNRGRLRSRPPAVPRQAEEQPAPADRAALLAKLRQDVLGVKSGVQGAKRASGRPEAGKGGKEPLTELVPGREVSNTLGSFYLATRRIESLDPAFADLLERHEVIFGRPLTEGAPDEWGMAALLALAQEEVLYLDLETMGLGGSAIILAGLLGIAEGRFAIEQYFARDYHEEEVILFALAERLKRASGLISFNGRAFDLPLLADRLIVHGLDCPLPALHLDLLHPARRQWGASLPNCRLQTLELFILNRRRRGDVPGDEVPKLYDQFVREGDPAVIAPVFLHNAIDLVSMAQLLLLLAAEEGVHYVYEPEP